jgi:hypothetical protein
VWRPIWARGIADAIFINECFKFYVVCMRSWFMLPLNSCYIMFLIWLVIVAGTLTVPVEWVVFTTVFLKKIKLAGQLKC